MRAHSEVVRFALRAIAWLAPAFAVWYAVAAWEARPAAWLAAGATGLVDKSVVNAIEWEGRIVRFVTAIEVQDAAGQAGLMLIEVNPQLYTYGTALVAALMLASRAGWRKLVLGIALLIPFQAWGIAFDALAQIVRAGPQAAAQAGIGGWRVEAVAFGYQAGSLIFPAAAPVLVWAAAQRQFVERLVQAQSRRDTPG